MGDMSETAYVSELWDVSRGRGTLDAFVRRHGYHGPNEGELAARVWRLDRRPLERLLVSYRGLGEEQDPRRMEQRRAAEREAAERELVGALPRHQRARARIILSLAACFVPLRGTGKAAFLQCVDVARVAARALGDVHVAAGRLAQAQDVFLLTLPELRVPQLPAGVAELVAERRRLREQYLGLELPGFWLGTPVPAARRQATAERDDRVVVTGTPVCPGVVEGIARLVIDPEEDDGPDEGEILVCRTTDPSWASVLVVAAAMVIDIGGPISHGAIVARELGVPCVIGTGDGTQVIRDGDRVRVDGTTGEVRVLERAAG
jgi:phosphohistidine swiveling domain-containing protein